MKNAEVRCSELANEFHCVGWEKMEFSESMYRGPLPVGYWDTYDVMG
jgi:hypothetical protein